jgi:flagellum-specific ATP synthase
MAEMIRLGAYRLGSDALVDLAIQKQPAFEAFLGQKIDERVSTAQTFEALAQILERTRTTTAPEATLSGVVDP